MTTAESMVPLVRGPLALLSGLLLACTQPAAAQQLNFNQTGDSNLNAINSGDVTLQGTVISPTVSGGANNSAGSLSAQGANSSYGINDQNYDANGNTVGTYTAGISNTNSRGVNTGSVSVRGTVNGSTLNGNNISQSIVATGYSNSISIKTTGK